MNQFFNEIQLTPYAGARLDKCISEAKALATITRRPTVFKFNGKEINVHQYTDEQSAYDSYMGDRK